MPKVAYTPEWKKYEKDLTSDDPNKARQAADAFAETREHEMATSKKARDWETSRKESILKEKPRYVKQRLAKEQEPLQKMAKDLKTAGVFNSGLVPSPGFVVIRLEQRESQTESGIILADNVDIAHINTGEVVGVGEGQRLDNGNFVKAPVKVGDKVLFKKGAGLEITLKDEKCRFMMYSDVLGIFT